MKKILGLTVVALLVMALVGTGTWAYFSDVETSTGNVFTAGTLNLVPATAGSGTCTVVVTAGSDGVNGNVVFSLVKPGDSGSITWTLNNSGDLPGTLTLTSTSTFTEGGANEPETSATVPVNNNGGNGDLDEYVGVTLTQKIGAAAATYLLGDVTNMVPISGLEAVLNGVVDQAMAASETIIYVISWTIAADVDGAGVDGKFGTADDVTPIDDNVLQSDTATIDATFTLEQEQ